MHASVNHFCGFHLLHILSCSSFPRYLLSHSLTAVLTWKTPLVESASMLKMFAWHHGISMSVISVFNEQTPWWSVSVHFYVRFTISKMSLYSLDKLTANCDSPHDKLVNEFGHGFSYFVWHLEVKMAPMDADRNVSLPTTSRLLACLSPFHSIGMLVVRNSYTSNKHSKMVGNSASYPVYSRNSQLS